MVLYSHVGERGDNSHVEGDSVRLCTSLDKISRDDKLVEEVNRCHKIVCERLSQCRLISSQSFFYMANPTSSTPLETMPLPYANHFFKLRMMRVVCALRYLEDHQDGHQLRASKKQHIRVVSLGCGPGPEIAAAQYHFPMSTAIGIDSFDWSNAVRSFVADFGQVRFQHRSVGNSVKDLSPGDLNQILSPGRAFSMIIVQCLLYDLSRAKGKSYKTFFEDYARLFQSLPNLMLLVIENGGSDRCEFLRNAARALERKVLSAKCVLIQPGDGCMRNQIQLQNVLFLPPRTALAPCPQGKRPRF